MVCGALSCFRFCSSDWCLVLGSRRAIRISGGEPGFRTPDHIVDAMKRAIEEGHTHYGEFAHIRELREAIAEKYRGLGVDVDPDRVLVTPGRARGLSSVDMAKYLREEANVVVTPRARGVRVLAPQSGQTHMGASRPRRSLRPAP